jgi:tRNA (guanine37-N1)-methyltransferase
MASNPALRIDVVTLFPDLFGPALAAGVLGRAVERGIVAVDLHDLREHGLGRHRQVDDTPYGGGAGMVIRRELAALPRFALVCGRYEGVDERVRAWVDREVSIGDYVLTGGELPALVVIDAVSRLVPGVIDPDSSAGDSFATGLLEHPQYTRPEEFDGMRVPPVLLSGNHGEVAAWRRREAIRRTRERRPDLLESAPLTDADRAELDRLESEGL